MEQQAQNSKQPPVMRLMLLGVITVLLAVVVVRKIVTPGPAYGWTGSDSNGIQLVPTDKSQSPKLVLYSNNHLLVFEVTGAGGLRLNGWRDVTHDHEIWDSSVAGLNRYGMETANGSTTDYLLPDQRNPKQGSLTQMSQTALDNSNPKIEIKLEGK
ncbi:MAG: hypothetical protein ACREJ2_13145 [Planctomycetota bacterium]